MATDEWTLTVRHGSSVTRETFGYLEAAVAGLEERAREIKSEGPLESVNAIRDYEPGMRIHTRLELSRGGWLRSAAAGIDVMGDGRFVAYRGGVWRRELDLTAAPTPFVAVEEHLREARR